jgi:DNA polymerase-3 subunit delta'
MVSDNIASAVPQLEPWLISDFNYLNKLFTNKKLPKVILLHGVHGIGKKILATKIASLILGDENHPDLIVAGQNNIKITIDEIRDIIDQSAQTAYLASHKVFMLLNAESLNTAASNALLKVLENESCNSYFN